MLLEAGGAAPNIGAPVVFRAFMDGAAALLSGPLLRLKFINLSLRAPMSDHVEPTGAGLDVKALGVMAGKDGGPWGWRRSPAGAGCCIMAGGGREVIDRPSRRSMAGPVCCGGAAAGAGAPNNVLVGRGALVGEAEVCRPENKSKVGC